MVDSCLAAVAPWRCVLCAAPAAGLDLCAGCLDDLPWLGDLCRHCGLPLGQTRNAACGRCAAHIGAGGQPVADYCIAAFAYEFPVDRLISGLKYQNKLEYARVLGDLLAIRLHEHIAQAELALPDVLLPVPLHPWRMARRGFNQAAAIAHWLAKQHGVPVAAQLAQRVRNTPRQAGLSRSLRLQNLRGAFRVMGSLAGARIALLDDVITTTATISALAKSCRRAGAREVQAWAVARVTV